MLRLAGEIADGVILWLCTPPYIRDVVIPAVREGRERAGKPLEGFDVVPAVPAAAVEDPSVAHASLRRELLPYFGLPFYRAMLERSGFGEEIAAFDAAAGAGDGDGHAAGDLGALPRHARRRRRRGGRARRRDALPRGGRDLAVRRADLEDRLRRDARGSYLVAPPNPAATRGASSCDSITRSIRPYSRACSAVK